MTTPSTRTEPSAALVPSQPGQRRLETYRAACATDLRATFERVRIEQGFPGRAEALAALSKREDEGRY